MDATTLKAMLESFSHEFMPPNTVDREAVLDAMVQHLGNPDPTLRDGLIYEALTFWTLKHGYVSIPRLRELASTLIDDQHLLYRIGQRDDASVFQRAFSALWLAVVINKNIHEPVIEPQQLTAIAQAIITYLHNERDLRGYTQDHGWAHGIAHASDVVKQLARCDGVDASVWSNVLNALGTAITTPTNAFVYEEDERAAAALITLLLHHRVPEKTFIEWLQRMGEVSQDRDLTNFRYINTKHLLRSLYIQMYEKPPLQVISTVLHGLITELHQ